MKNTPVNNLRKRILTWIITKYRELNLNNSLYFKIALIIIGLTICSFLYSWIQIYGADPEEFKLNKGYLFAFITLLLINTLITGYFLIWLAARVHKFAEVIFGNGQKNGSISYSDDYARWIFSTINAAVFGFVFGLIFFIVVKFILPFNPLVKDDLVLFLAIHNCLIGMAIYTLLAHWYLCWKYRCEINIGLWNRSTSAIHEYIFLNRIITWVVTSICLFALVSFFCLMSTSIDTDPTSFTTITKIIQFVTGINVNITNKIIANIIFVAIIFFCVFTFLILIGTYLFPAFTITQVLRQKKQGLESDMFPDQQKLIKKAIVEHDLNKLEENIKLQKIITSIKIFPPFEMQFYKYLFGSSTLTLLVPYITQVWSLVSKVYLD